MRRGFRTRARTNLGRSGKVRIYAQTTGSRGEPTQASATESRRFMPPLNALTRVDASGARHTAFSCQDCGK